MFYVICASVPLQKELANNTNCPHMCAYKLVSIECKWRGFQTMLEKTIQKVQHCCLFYQYGIFDTYCFLWPIICTEDNVFCFELKYHTTISLECSHAVFLTPQLCPDGEAYFHQLPQTAVLLDRQLDRPVHGWHPTYRGWDKERAGYGDWAY